MFDNFLIRADSLQNVIADGKITGFKFAVRIADYRGCFLSLHNGYYINCDGVVYSREVPGSGAGAGKTDVVCQFELDLQQETREV